jgi:endonuclease/exonuclease/phosphatase family metal-dependent hydrolase
MEIKVMTYNIRRLGEEPDEGNLWKNRKQHVIDLIAKHDPDLLCIQEDHPDQVADLSASLGYKTVGSYNEALDSGISGEALSILFKPQYRLIESRLYYLTPTPETRSRLEGQSKYSRNVNYARIAFGSLEVDVYNTHFDHLSEAIREKEAMALMSIARIDGPYIICGDFNGDENSRHVSYLKERLNLINSGVSEKTVIDWSGTHPPRECIDFIFSSLPRDRFFSDKTEILGRTPSDHLPIIAILERP